MELLRPFSTSYVWPKVFSPRVIIRDGKGCRDSGTLCPVGNDHHGFPENCQTSTTRSCPSPALLDLSSSGRSGINKREDTRTCCESGREECPVHSPLQPMTTCVPAPAGGDGNCRRHKAECSERTCYPRQSGALPGGFQHTDDENAFPGRPRKEQFHIPQCCHHTPAQCPQSHQVGWVYQVSGHQLDWAGPGRSPVSSDKVTSSATWIPPQDLPFRCPPHDHPLSLSPPHYPPPPLTPCPVPAPPDPDCRVQAPFPSASLSNRDISTRPPCSDATPCDMSCFTAPSSAGPTEASTRPSGCGAQRGTTDCVASHCSCFPACCLSGDKDQGFNGQAPQLAPAQLQENDKPVLAPSSFEKTKSPRHLVVVQLPVSGGPVVHVQQSAVKESHEAIGTASGPLDNGLGHTADRECPETTLSHSKRTEAGQTKDKLAEFCRSVYVEKDIAQHRQEWREDRPSHHDDRGAETWNSHQGPACASDASVDARVSDVDRASSVRYHGMWTVVTAGTIDPCSLCPFSSVTEGLPERHLHPVQSDCSRLFTNNAGDSISDTFQVPDHEPRDGVLHLATYSRCESGCEREEEGKQFYTGGNVWPVNYSIDTRSSSAEQCNFDEPFDLSTKNSNRESQVSGCQDSMLSSLSPDYQQARCQSVNVCYDVHTQARGLNGGQQFFGGRYRCQICEYAARNQKTRVLRTDYQGTPLMHYDAGEPGYSLGSTAVDKPARLSPSYGQQSPHRCPHICHETLAPSSKAGSPCQSRFLSCCSSHCLPLYGKHIREHHAQCTEHSFPTSLLRDGPDSARPASHSCSAASPSQMKQGEPFLSIPRSAASVMFVSETAVAGQPLRPPQTQILSAEAGQAAQYTAPRMPPTLRTTTTTTSPHYASSAPEAANVSSFLQTAELPPNVCASANQAEDGRSPQTVPQCPVSLSTPQLCPFTAQQCSLPSSAPQQHHTSPLLTGQQSLRPPPFPAVQQCLTPLSPAWPRPAPSVQVCGAAPAPHQPSPRPVPPAVRPAQVKGRDSDRQGKAAHVRPARKRRTRLRTFQCHLCSVACSNRGQLRGHLRTHTGGHSW